MTTVFRVIDWSIIGSLAAYILIGAFRERKSARR